MYFLQVNVNVNVKKTADLDEFLSINWEEKKKELLTNINIGNIRIDWIRRKQN